MDSNKKKENVQQEKENIRSQLCPNCLVPMGDMPGTRDAVCHNCGFKDPCCE